MRTVSAALLIAVIAPVMVLAAPKVTEIERRMEEPAHLRLMAQDAAPLRYEQVADLFDPLCADFLADLTAAEHVPDQIVVSFSDRLMEFGETNTEAVQFFELYDVIDGNCVWRAF